MSYMIEEMRLSRAALLVRLGEVPRLADLQMLDPQSLRDTVGHRDLEVLRSLADLVELVWEPSEMESAELLDRALLHESVRAPFRAQANPPYTEWDCPCGKDHCHYTESRVQALEIYAEAR